MMRLLLLAFLAISVQARYTPKYFAPSAYYKPGKTPTFRASSSGKLSDTTKTQVAGILNGILGNLMKQKAAVLQVAANISISDDACPIDAPIANFFGALSFQVPDEKTVVDFMKHSSNSTKNAKEPTDAEKAEWKAAMDEYKESQMEMQKSSARMMKAMDNMLEVPSMTKETLTAMTAKKDKDTFVVFYAPWCGHCQTFVLHDGKGNPEKSPLELFNKEMKSRGASKTLNVVRWNVDAHKDVPSQFKVQYIPAMYLAAADGTVTPFKGNPAQTAEIVKFIEEKSSKTKKIEKLALR